MNLKETIKRVAKNGKLTVLAAVAAITVVSASTALAGTGVGATFNLGQQNVVDSLSRLVGNVNDGMLRIVNNNTGSSATALQLFVQPGKAPMTVNSDTKVANLNADKLDGQDSTSFLGKFQQAFDSGQLDGNDSSEFLQIAHVYEESITGPSTPNTEHTITRNCDGGDFAMGGGFSGVDSDSTLIKENTAFNQSAGWSVKYKTGATADAATITVKCADFGSQHQ